MGFETSSKNEGFDRDKATKEEQSFFEKHIMGKPWSMTRVRTLAIVTLMALAYNAYNKENKNTGQETGGVKIGQTDTIQRPKLENVETADSDKKFFEDKQKAYGQDQEEIKMERKEKALSFLEQLFQAPTPEDGWKLIQQFAIQDKEARNSEGLSPQQEPEPVGSVGTEDVKNTLEYLNTLTGDYADKHFGNNDGKVSANEGNSITQRLKENPGFIAFLQMTNQYH